MQMSHQLSDLKLSSCSPGALINQSDAQVLWSYVVPEPRVVTAIRCMVLLLGANGLRPLVCALGFC